MGVEESNFSTQMTRVHLITNEGGTEVGRLKPTGPLGRKAGPLVASSVQRSCSFACFEPKSVSRLTSISFADPFRRPGLESRLVLLPATTGALLLINRFAQWLLIKRAHAPTHTHTGMPRQMKSLGM